MAFAKRIFFFALVNIAMVLTISFVLSIFNVRPYLHAYGLDYSSLAIFCLVWGMGGAFFSLALSRVIAKWTMGIQLVDVNSPGESGELARSVQKLAMAARLPMPQVGIFDSAQPNAFATGPTKNRALVAVSTGLLRTMRPNELEGVLAHEITHVANGDMVTMTLIQGVVNAFVMFLARIAAFAIMQAMQSRNDRDSGRSTAGGMMYFMTTMVFELVFGLIGAIIVSSFSRWREFRADRGGAMLAGREAMQSALRRLQSFQQPEQAPASPALAALMINGKRGGFMNLFATHPPLDVRIERLNH
jgi:heat shock protein HtpX